MCSFTGGELNFLKQGSILVGFSLLGVCQIFLESQCSQIAVFEFNCDCSLALKWSHNKSIHEVFTCFVCVLICRWCKFSF